LLVLFILVVGHFFALTMARLAVHLSSKANTDKKERAVAYSMVDRTVYWCIMLIVLMILPAIVGVEMTAVVALIGSLIFAIGLGLQGTLGDISAGVMLLAAGTFKIGDYIELADSKLKGTVSTFSILYTHIRDENTGVNVIVPNKILYNSILYNHTSTIKHTIVTTFFISNSNIEVDRIMSAVVRNVQNFPRVFSEPLVTCNVSEITPFGTSVEVRYVLSRYDYQVHGTNSVQTQIMTIIRKTILDEGGELVNLGLGKVLKDALGAMK
jgi:small-conductance mechanosensitive channel